jgi:hypothetical protein
MRHAVHKAAVPYRSGIKYQHLVGCIIKLYEGFGQDSASSQSLLRLADAFHGQRQT